MGHVYAFAGDMVIWLGPERQDTTFILARIRGGKFPEGTEVLPVLKALKRLCRRPWFGRLWVAQESALFTNLDVLIGHHILRWDCFHGFVRRMSESASFNIHRKHEAWPRAACYYFQCAASRVTNLEPLKYVGGGTLVTQLNRTKHLLASDPRGKVYGVPNLCDTNLLGINIFPNYTKSVQQVFAAATFAMLLETSRILHLVYNHHTATRKNGRPQQEWPSYHHGLWTRPLKLRSLSPLEPPNQVCLFPNMRMTYCCVIDLAT